MEVVHQLPIITYQIYRKELTKIGVRTLKGLVNIGEDVLADGKVDLKDIVHIKPLIDEAMNVVKAIKAYKEIGAEIKDIDGVEAVRLMSIIFEKQK